VLATAATVNIGSDPYLVPAILLVCALLAALLASMRGRHAKRRTRLLANVHVVVSLAALVICGVITVDRASQFWGTSWHGEERMLVLERLAPLGSVSLHTSEIDRVLEVAKPEHTWAGRRARVHFEVVTRDGRYFRSAPAYRRTEAARTRSMLAVASGDRMERLIVGSANDLLR
jgi:hypothetical protein